MLVVLYILHVVTARLHIRRAQKSDGSVLRETLQTDTMSAGKLDHKVHFRAKGVHLAPRVVVTRFLRSALQVGER